MSADWKALGKSYFLSLCFPSVKTRITMTSLFILILLLLGQMGLVPWNQRSVLERTIWSFLLATASEFTSKETANLYKHFCMWLSQILPLKTAGIPTFTGAHVKLWITAKNWTAWSNTWKITAKVISKSYYTAIFLHKELSSVYQAEATI